MRFKKLRFSVGVALIMFILLSGYIIISGELLSDKSTIKAVPVQNIAAIPEEDKKLLSQIPQIPTQLPTITETKNQEVRQMPANVKINNAPVAEPIPMPEPVVIHRRRTRAS